MFWKIQFASLFLQWLYRVVDANTDSWLPIRASVSLQRRSTAGITGQRGLVAGSLAVVTLRSPSIAMLPSHDFSIDRGTKLFPLRLIAKQFLDRWAFDYLSVVAQLDAVLDPGISG